MRNPAHIAVGILVAASAGAAGQQSSVPPETHAARRSSSSASREVQCQSESTRWKLPFDPSRYALPENREWHIRPLYNPAPEYSEEARKGNVQGTVVLAVAVNENGSVDAVNLLRSLGHGLDETAMNAVKQWKFAPTDKDGKPVAVQFDVEITFEQH